MAQYVFTCVKNLAANLRERDGPPNNAVALQRAYGLAQKVRELLLREK